jgi:protein-glutamine gamma-glutamyltransferase
MPSRIVQNSISPTSIIPIPLSAAIDRYFEVALYLLVFVGFGTLASTGGLDLPTVLFVSAALLYRGYGLVTRRPILIPERWTTPLTVAYAVFYVADYLVISRTFLNSTVHLVLFVLVLRLFSARRERDFYFLAVLAFLMLLAASVLTVDSTFLFAFVGFMLVGVVTFILMEMRSASVRAGIGSRPFSDSRASRQMGLWLVAAAPAFVLFIFLAGAAIFFILPRLSSSYLIAYAGGGIATGFSDHVQLGQIGAIQQSRALVMHIQIDGDRRGAFDLKWRGVTLNLFNGTTWSNPHEQHFVRRVGGRFILTSRDERAPMSAAVIHYRVLMEPVASSVFFLAPTPVTLEGNYRVVSMDGGGGVFDPDPEHPVNSYDASSNIAQPTPAQLRSASQDYPPEILLNDLQTPGSLDPRILRLAEQIAVPESNNYDKAAAIERYLRTHFTYTLQLPRTLHRDPVANFLFERKQGHCEYFASAMAVMLRTLGIPSRVVNGFRTGEFNDLTSQYLVRASNAHSWVEAYFPGYGWISFDPTPSAPVQTHTGWGRAMLYLDALDSFWREWIVNYDVSHQHTLGQQATRNTLEWFRDSQEWSRREYQRLLDAARRSERTVTGAPLAWSLTAAAAAFPLVLGANAQKLWRALSRRRVASQPEKAPRAAATIWYERALRALGKKGLQKSPAQTPDEFLRSIVDPNLREPVSRLTEHYKRARFGESPQDAARLPELFEEITGKGRH